MRRCNANCAEQDEDYFSERVFFKKPVGKDNQEDAADEEKQSSDSTMLPEISG